MSISTHIPEVFGTGDVTVSFEFFPPKNEAMEERLWDSIHTLAHFKPEFVSVTYGAGGSTQAKTAAIVEDIKAKTSLDPASHLTCVGATKDSIADLMARYKKNGINRIIALRGDLPESESYSKELPYAANLVAFLKDIGGFDISVAGYPETHPKAKSPETDLKHLKEKVDAGASRVITQFCFSASTYLNFQERAQSIGINKPIVPGIMPIYNFPQIKRFASMCGAVIPDWLDETFKDKTEDEMPAIGTAIAANIVKELYEAGNRQFHFYTLNRAEAAAAICRLLGR